MISRAHTLCFSFTECFLLNLLLLFSLIALFESTLFLRFHYSYVHCSLVSQFHKLKQKIYQLPPISHALHITQPREGHCGCSFSQQ